MDQIELWQHQRDFNDAQVRINQNQHDINRLMQLMWLMNAITNLLTVAGLMLHIIFSR